MTPAEHITEADEHLIMATKAFNEGNDVYGKRQVELAKTHYLGAIAADLVDLPRNAVLNRLELVQP